jgi:hypothetical protein
MLEVSKSRSRRFQCWSIYTNFTCSLRHWSYTSYIHQSELSREIAIFCLPGCCLKTWRLKYKKIYLLLCKGVKLALTLCEERGLSVSQNRTLGIKFGSNCKRDEVTAWWRICIMRSTIICTLKQCCWDNWIKQDEMGEACSGHGWDYKSVQFFNGRDHSEDLNVDGWI